MNKQLSQILIFSLLLVAFSISSCKKPKKTSFEITVINSDDGKAVPNAKVEMTQSLDDFYDEKYSESKTTNNEGKVKWDNIAPGTWHIYATADISGSTYEGDIGFDVVEEKDNKLDLEIE